MTQLPHRAPIRVIVADDHAAVRAGLVALLDAAEDIHVVGEAGDGPQTLAIAREHRPDVVLTDVRMPGATGIDITPDLCATGARVLVVSSFDLDDYVLGALAAGADGYLVKSEDPARFLAAVRAVAAGDAALSREAMRAVLARLRGGEPATVEALPPPPPGPALTAREEDVLRLLATGMSNREIARELFIELTTVKSHLTHVLAKLGVDSRLQAALWWQENR
ncbi:response regulator [Brachybacterium hainanense]|uniref:Response regulator n=1 Tax=Brachybacterium hainanense TaxID=1541174 RepID=A0ABV6REV7_9MICO